ncbi:hypothetical protein A9Q84_13220 [Halobacteriovorax marinus]|uniref:Acyltransferase n=1 Tax=Halobacteriovorax marinus TaxID=97084 RepID=A0A1Y5FCV0_9BACT|nr:hypothetical protein A9Q84_13220 [Halobacteriovorax marinus]
MKYAPLVARLLLGTIFFVFGLNGFFNFISMPPLPEEAGKFMGGLAGSGYFFPFLKVCEILSGLLLLAGAFVPMALVILAPIILNIFLFHIFLAPGGMVLAIVLVLLECYLAFFASPYKEIIRNIFRCPKLESMKKG